MINWENRYLFVILIGAFIVTFLVIIFLFIGDNNPTLKASQTIIAILIGYSASFISTLTLEEYNSKKNKKELFIFITSDMTHNLESAQSSLEVLKNEIVEIEKKEYKLENLSIPLFPMKTEIWELLKRNDSEDMLADYYTLAIQIALLSDHIDNQLKVRENLIIFKYGDSINQIKNIDEKLINTIEGLITKIKEFRKLYYP